MLFHHFFGVVFLSISHWLFRAKRNNCF
jgi:hypothetical protein